MRLPRRVTGVVELLHNVGGVPAGTSSPYHVLALKPGLPWSAMVGTFGNTGLRDSADAAIARNWPL
jgi:hypothetical protein